LPDSEKTFVIGTRASLLAVTQCTLVKNQLEKISGRKFSLKLIETEGDQKTDKPLWQLEGKDFFTKELDSALLMGEVDMVVHSYKDLGSERPEGIKLAAVTRRASPYDILLFNKNSFDHESAKRFCVGTSSPRRISNTTAFLKDFLPSPISKLPIETEVLRGNVNTRIQKLRDGKYDAIILAMAGLERLCGLQNSKKQLRELLNGLDYSILPADYFTPAASQGALAIECLDGRNDDGELEKILDCATHGDTWDSIKKERAIFNSYGGGCHLAVGIHVEKKDHHYIHRIQGEVDGKRVESYYSEPKVQLACPADKDQNKVFVGLAPEKVSENYLSDKLLEKKSVIAENGPYPSGHFFVTSWHCIDNLEKVFDSGRVWVSGSKTWKALASRGFWVNGSADYMGHGKIAAFRNSPLVKLFGEIDSVNDKCNVLTHKDSDSEIGEILPSYERVTKSLSPEYVEKLKSAQYFFWTSFHQYSQYTDLIPEIKNGQHFCGLGKTLAHFKENNIKITSFSNLSEFLNWTKGNAHE
jgi:hydroxymethylbilane synthase